MSAGHLARLGAALFALFGVLAVALGPQMMGPGAAAAITAAGNGGASSRAFSVTGSVGGLFPGAQTNLPLTITNHMSFAIQVDSISVAVAGSGPGCPASELSATNFNGAKLVAAHASAMQPIPISMSAAAPDTCQGVTFPLTYSARAVRAAG